MPTHEPTITRIAAENFSSTAFDRFIATPTNDFLKSPSMQPAQKVPSEVYTGQIIIPGDWSQAERQMMSQILFMQQSLDRLNDEVTNLRHQLEVMPCVAYSKEYIVKPDQTE